MRGFFGVLILGLVALVAGLIGYQAGLTSTAAAAGNVVYVTGGWFPGIGTLFFLFSIGFLFFAFAGRRRAWGGGYGHWGGYGRGPWGGPTGVTGPDASDDPRRQWVADMHRSLHEAEAKTGGPTSPADPTTPTNPPTAG